MTDELTMTDGQRLHRRILECPEDDQPRLCYSDWLEECGEEERARFIRWQVAGEISDAEAEYREGEPYGNPDETNVLAFDSMRRMRAGWVKFFPEFKGSARVVMSRGFVSEVRLTCEQFCGGPCQACQGRGIVLHVFDEEEHCKVCQGTGRTDGVARELFLAHPITTVRLTNLSPLYVGGSPILENGYWCFWGIGFLNVPDWLAEQFASERFDTEAAALDALSAACVAHGRRLAGLPALEEVGK